MPEMGFDDDPISPVSRDETVTNKKPNSTISKAPIKFMCSGLANWMAAISTTMPMATNLIDKSWSVRTPLEPPLRWRWKSANPPFNPCRIVGSDRMRLITPPAATAPAPI